jgi:hypothetical protein
VLPLLLGLAAACAEGPVDPAAAAAALTGAAGTPGTIALEGAKIPGRGTFRVTVADADADLDTASLDGVVVHVSVARPPGAAGPSTPALLVETGPSTGLFAADLPVPAGVRTGDVVGVEYRDPNTGGCTPGSVRASATVDADSANLLFASVSVPEKLVAGEPFQVAGVLANDSRGAAAGPSELCASLSRPGWDYEGYEIVESLGSWRVAVGEIVAGGVSSFTLSGTVPPNDSLRPLTLELRADCGNAVPEWREDDNLYRRTLGIDGPDLVVDPSVPPPGVVSGHPLDVTATVRNVGAATSIATTVRLRIHRPGHDEEGYDIDESYVLDTRPVPSLLAAGSHTVTLHGVVPEGLNGWFQVEVYVDPYGVVAEGIEANNVPSPEATIWVNGADLTVALDPGTPASAVAGQPLVVSGRVWNGTGVARAAASAVSVRFHRPAHDAEGYHIDESYAVGTASIPALEPGGFADFTVAGSAPANLAGGFTLEAVADAGRAVPESNEQNNGATAAFTVIGANLTVAPVEVPALADVSPLPYEIRVRVQNAPGGEAALASTVSATLSRETCCDADGYEFDEAYLLGTAPVSPLAPGEAEVVAISGTIPATASRAPFTLTVRADALRVVQENDESNDWSTQVTVR